MTLLFMDGFDDYNDIDDLWKKWSNYYIHLSYAFDYYSSGGRFSGGCIGNDSTLSHIDITFANKTEAIVGFAFKRGPGSYSQTGMIQFHGSNHLQGSLQINEGGNLQWNGDNCYDSELTSYALKPDTWYYIEVRLKPFTTTGEIEVKVNGITWITGVGTTQYPGRDGVDMIRFHGAMVTTGGFYFDDVYVIDTLGAKNNTFLGDVRVIQLKPNGIGNYAEFTPSAGDNYECVDDAVWGGSDYVETTVNEEMDTHTFEDLPSDLGAIKGIQIVNGSKKLVQSDATKMKHVIRKNSTDYLSSEAEITDDISGAVEIYETDPEDSADWTKAKLDVTEFGYQAIIS